MATETKFVRDMDRIILRVPDGVRERLATEAKARGLSMNALVVEMLERALDSGEEFTLAVLRAEMRDVERRLATHEQNAAETREYLSHLQREARELETGFVERGADPSRVTRSAAVRRLAEQGPIKPPR